MSWRTPMHNRKSAKSNSARIITKIILFASVMLFAMRANAEYYFVYPNSCCSAQERSHHATHHAHKKIKWSHHKTKHYKKYVRKNTSHYACSYTTSCCQKQNYHRHHSMKEWRESGIDRDNYSHDLSTGDDNTFFYPGMNIDQ